MPSLRIEYKNLLKKSFKVPKHGHNQFGIVCHHLLPNAMLEAIDLLLPRNQPLLNFFINKI